MSRGEVKLLLVPNKTTIRKERGGGVFLQCLLLKWMAGIHCRDIWRRNVETFGAAMSASYFATEQPTLQRTAFSSCWLYLNYV